MPSHEEPRTSNSPRPGHDPSVSQFILTRAPAKPTLTANGDEALNEIETSHAASF